MDTLTGEKRVKMEDESEVENENKRQKVEIKQEDTAVIQKEATGNKETEEYIKILWLHIPSAGYGFYRKYTSGDSYSYKAKIGTYTKKTGEYLLDFFSKSAITRNSVVSHNSREPFSEPTLEKLLENMRFNVFRMATQYPAHTELLQTLPIDEQTRIIIEGTLWVGDVVGDLSYTKVTPITVVGKCDS
jgi:hypothetical protein